MTTIAADSGISNQTREQNLTREDLKAGLSDQVFGEDSKASDNNASVTKVDFGIFKQDHTEVEESFQNTPDDGLGNFDTFQQLEEVS